MIFVRQRGQGEMVVETLRECVRGPKLCHSFVERKTRDGRMMTYYWKIYIWEADSLIGKVNA